MVECPLLFSRTKANGLLVIALGDGECLRFPLYLDLSLGLSLLVGADDFDYGDGLAWIQMCDDCARV